VRFSSSLFRFIITLLICYITLLHIRRENSQELKVSDFGAIGSFIPVANFAPFCTVAFATPSNFAMIEYGTPGRCSTSSTLHAS
jgi:hypothetical protein